MYALLALKFDSQSYRWANIHEIEDKHCGEALLKALSKWGGAAGVTNQRIMERTLKFIDKVKASRNIKGFDAAVQGMVELINYIVPDQRPCIDKMFSATVLTIMQKSEVPSLLVQTEKPLPDVMPRGETAEWFFRIRDIVDRNAASINDDFPAYSKTGERGTGIAVPRSEERRRPQISFHSNIQLVLNITLFSLQELVPRKAVSTRNAPTLTSPGAPRA